MNLNDYYNIILYIKDNNNELLNMNQVMKFDVVLMNPPYDKKLHEKFLYKAIEISNNIISVQPLTWLTNQKQNKKLTEKINKIGCFIEQIDPNKYFDGAFAQDVAIITINKKTNNNIIFNGKLYKQCSEITKYSNDEFLVRFKKIIDKILTISLDDKFKFVPNIPGHPKDKHTEYNPDKNWFIVKGAAIRGHIGTNDFITLIPKPSSKEFLEYFCGKFDELCKKEYRGKNNISYYWAFNSMNEANNFINYIQSDFARTCLLLNKTTTNIIGGALKHIPWFDFSDNVFSKTPIEIDDYLFKKYDISDDIRKHIEEILPDYYNIR